jgi:hypothetical protein
MRDPEHIDWPADDPRWFWTLFRPMHNDPHKTVECCECFRLILARCGPHYRDADYRQTMLHEVVAHGDKSGVALATMLLDAGARVDVRDDVLKSTPLRCVPVGRIEIVRLFLARGADPVEADAEPWATPRAWAERMHRTEIVELLDSARTTATLHGRHSLYP